MVISSVTATPIKPVAIAKAQSEDSVEGTKPDGDSDQDDSARASTGVQTNTNAQVTASLGNNLNVIA